MTERYICSIERENLLKLLQEEKETIYYNVCVLPTSDHMETLVTLKISKEKDDL